MGTPLTDYMVRYFYFCFTPPSLVFLELCVDHLVIQPVLLNGKRHKSREGNKKCFNCDVSELSQGERWEHGGVVYG